MRPIKWFDLRKKAIECNDFLKPEAFHFGAAFEGHRRCHRNKNKLSNGRRERERETTTEKEGGESVQIK